jgi:hypothetical protein
MIVFQVAEVKGSRASWEYNFVVLALIVQLAVYQKSI